MTREAADKSRKKGTQGPLILELARLEHEKSTEGSGHVN